jgi:Tol biopolymer transport system component
MALHTTTATFLLLPLFVVASFGQSKTTSEARTYLGQDPPGTTPVVFAPGTVSTGHIHSRLEISPDGRDLFWNTVDMKTFTTQILTVRNTNGTWSAPAPPPFAREGSSQGAVFSPDGKTLFFSVIAGDGWVRKYVEKTDAGWSDVHADGFRPNGSTSFTTSGRAYFSGEMTTKIWHTGVFSARYTPDGVADAAALGEAINRPNTIDYTPYISPDESFLLFSSNRPLSGDKEEMFINISVRKRDGSWSIPARVSQIPARFPSLSPDGRYLFFCGDDGNFYWADRAILDRFLKTS